MYKLNRIAIFSLLCSGVFLSCGKNDTVQPPTTPSQATEERLTMIDKLSEESIEVDTQAMRIDDKALAWLDELGDKRVVGLGEATHGTKEFFEMKGRLRLSNSRCHST